MTSFPDQVHLDQIAAALWRKSPLGNAALMVGAGMSRNARNIADPSRMMPTWGELAESLCEKLYPSSDKSISRQRDHALKKAHSTSGALRLAQEFEASFGRTELNRLLKTFTPDEDYTPSDLHTDLLKLPWADVFTTNWDTLLERAVDTVVDRRYDVVRTRDDIPASQQPRIVKLHGSFPSNYPFIFAEEDYRSYPKKFAHFVNMAQQSMMENLFCLIGFSGDDPNFLHWTGWVRDNLGESAPKIYMVGWLELAPVQRRMLEDRNVVPVDLSRLPQDQVAEWPEECRHRYALEWFLWMLKRKRPATRSILSSWQGQSHTPPDYLKIKPELLKIDREKSQLSSNTVGQGQEEKRLEALRQLVLEWRIDRKGYEGWVIAPTRVRSTIWRETSAGGISMILPLMPPWEKLFVLREVVWRLEVCLAPLFHDLVRPVAQLLDDINPNSRQCLWDGKEIQWTEPDWPEARKAWFEVAIALLRHYRYDRQSDQFTLLAARIEGLKGCGYSSDALTYQRILFALQDMDYAALYDVMQRWHVENSDHIWAIRKAGILFEIGDFDTAYNLLVDTLPAIRRSIRRDSDDFSALSREGCAMCLLEVAGQKKHLQDRAETERINKLHLVNSSNGMARLRRSAMAMPGNENSKKLDSGKFDSVNSPEWRARWKTLLVNDCDIRKEWENLCAILDAEPPDPRTEMEVRERGFDLGDISTSYQSKGWQFLPAFQALLFTEAAGMPPHIFSGEGGLWILGSGGMERAALWLKSVEPALAIRTLMRTCNSERDKILTMVVTRERIALLDEGTAETFVEIFVQAIKLLVPAIVTDKKYVGKLTVAMELLSRLVLRLTGQEKIKKVFDLAISLTHNRGISNHRWLAAPLANLLHRTVECFEAHAQADIILPLLELPTAGIAERVFDNELWWDTISQTKEQLCQIRDGSLGKWTEIVCRLLSAAATRESRNRAVFRLTFLHDKEMLSEAEQQRFMTALWSEEFIQAYGLPGQTDLNCWVFLILPEPEKGQVDRLIRKAYLTQPEAEKKSLTDYLNDFGGIADAARRRKIALVFTPEEASVVKSMVLKWAAEKPTPSSDLFVKQTLANSEIQKYLGLAYLLPFVSVTTEEMTLVQERIETLESARIPCYVLYPGLISKQPELDGNFIRRLNDAIGGDDAEFAGNAIYALFFWLSLAETGHNHLPPLEIINEVGLTIHLRHEPALAHSLHFASKLFNDHPELARAIAENCLLGLGYLHHSCEYRQAIQSGLAERIDIPLVRCNCVKLAIAMSNAGYGDNTVIINWISDAKVDPLPELRNLVAGLD